MARGVSTIIPARNEEGWIARSIDSARLAGAAEVIVADCGSTDATATIAEEHGAMVLRGSALRASGLNAAAHAASGDALVFLHADTTLPAGGCRAITGALKTAIFGGFRLDFAESTVLLRMAAAAINFRTSITRCPWGDQAQFTARDRFLASGGFLDIPIMEDYEFAVRMKRLGPTVVLPQRVVTSGRRFLRKGVLRTAWINWRVIAAYRSGATPEELERMYRE
jgi:rSAM/selenodomain-associated transferase 2